MIASKVTRETLEAAARDIGVAAQIDGMGRRFKVKLLPDVPAECYTAGGRRKRGERGHAPYQRTSAGTHDERRVHAVCWHGFRDYFRAVYKREPDAVFRTAIDTWRGADDFEARYRASGHHNVGSQIYPRAMAEVCACPESGMAV